MKEICLLLALSIFNILGLYQPKSIEKFGRGYNLCNRLVLHLGVHRPLLGKLITEKVTI